MEIDALGQKKKPMGKAKAPAKPAPVKKPAQRLAPHPFGGPLKTPSSSKAPPKPTPSTSRSQKTFYCYLCNKPGHFARNCKNDIRGLSPTHINNMQTALDVLYVKQGFQAEERPDIFQDELLDHPLYQEEVEEEAEEEVEESLIDFGEEENPEDQEETGEEQQDF